MATLQTLKEKEYQKWLAKPSVQKKENIIKLKTENPDRTLQSIGEEIGVSREYVRQILKEFEIDTSWESKGRIPLPNNCSSCDVDISIETNHYRKLALCKSCRDEQKYANVFRDVVCPNCKKVYSLRKSDRRIKISEKLNGRDPFCSRSCASRYNDIGNKYGLPALVKARGGE